MKKKKRAKEKEKEKTIERQGEQGTAAIGGFFKAYSMKFKV